MRMWVDKYNSKINYKLNTFNFGFNQTRKTLEEEVKKIISILFLMIIIANVLLAETKTEIRKATSCINIYNGEATLIFGEKPEDREIVQYDLGNLSSTKLWEWKITLKDIIVITFNEGKITIDKVIENETKYNWLTIDQTIHQLECIKNENGVIIIKVNPKKELGIIPWYFMLLSFIVIFLIQIIIFAVLYNCTNINVNLTIYTITTFIILVVISYVHYKAALLPITFSTILTFLIMKVSIMLLTNEKTKT